MNDNTQELIENLDMETYLETEGIAYKKGRGSSGPQLNLKECPECGNRHWKVYLNADSGLGNCFACNLGLNKAKLIHLHTGLSWNKTFDHIREVVKEQGWRPKNKIVIAVDDGEVKLPLSFPLPTADGQNLVYLERRGITGETAKHFHMRYCTTGWWNFTKDDGSQGGQRFDDRIILPVYDLDGTLKTFQGRDITGTADRKYLFPLGLPGTGRFLFNGQTVQRAKRIAVGEGVFDVAAIKIAFDATIELRGVIPVGTFGKHLSYGDMNGDDQLGRFIQLQADGVEEVTFMWDGEWKALIAAIDAAELLRKVGLKTRIALLPAGKDPNEISAAILCAAFIAAKPYSPQLAIKWRLRNPFAGKSLSSQ